MHDRVRVHARVRARVRTREKVCINLLLLYRRYIHTHKYTIWYIHTHKYPNMGEYQCESISVARRIVRTHR